MNGIYSTRSRTQVSKPQPNKLKNAASPTLFEYPEDRSNLEPGRSVIIFTKSDYNQLQPAKFFNDTIISFFMQYHLDHEVPPELKSCIHVFNSFFFEKIKSLKDKKDCSMPSFGCASRWFKGVDIFDKDFLFMPVCERDHWLLIIVCYPNSFSNSKPHEIPDEELKEPAVFVLNSAQGVAPPIKRTLGQFLQYQWFIEKEVKRTFCIRNAKPGGLRMFFPDIPQQKNSSDCGVYILNYFFCFLKDPRKAYIKIFRRHNMKTWFLDNQVDISRQRRKMTTLIKQQIISWNEQLKTHTMTDNNNDLHETNETLESQLDSPVDLTEESNSNSIIVIH